MAFWRFHWSARRSSSIPFILLLLAAGWLVACQSEDHPLAFEPIVQEALGGVDSPYYGHAQPVFEVVTTAEEVEALKGSIQIWTLEALRSVDFDRYFAVIVFHRQIGWMPHSPEGLVVEQVTRRGDEVIISATFYDDPNNVVRGQIVSSPYQVVKIEKEEVQGEIDFVVNVDGQSAQEQYFIP